MRRRNPTGVWLGGAPLRYGGGVGVEVGAMLNADSFLIRAQPNKSLDASPDVSGCTARMKAEGG